MSKRNYELRITNSGFAYLLMFSIFSCSSNSGSADTNSVKFKQYYVQGEALYLKHCSNCHQPTGAGLGLVYPPLNKSDYMDQNFQSVLCLMKYGSQGNLMVNGKTFVQPMPGVSSLTNLEIAEIATYIYNSWENEKGIVDVTEVSKVMEHCATSQ